MKIKPVKDVIVVKKLNIKDYLPQISKSGIVMSSDLGNKDVETASAGEVLDVGEGFLLGRDFKSIPLKVGDKILYSSGHLDWLTRWKDKDTNEIIMMTYAKVFAKIEE